MRTAPGRLETLRTPEGVTLPPNTLAELRRDMARLRFVTGQITEIEQARLGRLRQAPAADGCTRKFVTAYSIRACVTDRQRQCCR